MMTLVSRTSARGNASVCCSPPERLPALCERRELLEADQADELTMGKLDIGLVEGSELVDPDLS